MSGITDDLAPKTVNVPKCTIFDNISKNQKWGQWKANFRQLLTPKMDMIYYWPFSPNFALFGIFSVFHWKNDLWVSFPTQFLSTNTNFKSELKKMKNVDFWNSLPHYLMNSKVNFKNPCFSIFFNSDLRFVFVDKNWVGKMPHISFLG